MKLVKILVTVLFASIFVVSSAIAADLKVGFVDMQKALSGTKLGGKAQKDYEAEFKGFQEKVQGKKTEYEKALADYNKQKESLTTEARQKKEEELVALEKEFKRLVGDSQEQLRRKSVQVGGDFRQKLVTVIQTIGKEEGYSAIYEKRADLVLYSTDALDITDKVIKKFDAANK